MIKDDCSARMSPWSPSCQDICLPLQVRRNWWKPGARTNAFSKRRARFQTELLRIENGLQLNRSGEETARWMQYGAIGNNLVRMPVPLDVYRDRSNAKSVRNMQITRARLKRDGPSWCFSELIGIWAAAVYGKPIHLDVTAPPGKRQSPVFSTESAMRCDKIYVPRAIESAGQVITVYDPIVHLRCDREEQDHIVRRV